MATMEFRILDSQGQEVFKTNTFPRAYRRRHMIRSDGNHAVLHVIWLKEGQIVFIDDDTGDRIYRSEFEPSGPYCGIKE